MQRRWLLYEYINDTPPMRTRPQRPLDWLAGQMTVANLIAFTYADTDTCAFRVSLGVG